MKPSRSSRTPPATSAPANSPPRWSSPAAPAPTNPSAQPTKSPSPAPEANLLFAGCPRYRFCTWVLGCLPLAQSLLTVLLGFSFFLRELCALCVLCVGLSRFAFLSRPSPQRGRSPIDFPHPQC